MLKSLRQRLPRNVWILGFVSLFADINSKMVQSVLPLFLVSVLGANLLTVGLIEGIAESTAAVVKIGSGALSDYWQRRKELAIVGYGLSTLVTVVFAVAASPAWVLLARFADRFGKGIRVAPRNALVADTTPPEKRGAAYGLRQTLDTIGAFLGPLLAAALLFSSEQNLRLVFWLALLPGMIAVLLLVLGVKEPARPNSVPQNPLTWHQLKQFDRRYWLLLAVALVFNLGNSSDAFLLLRAQQIGVPTSLVPLTLVLINLSYGCSAYPAGVLSDRVGRVGLLLSGFILFACTYLGFAFVQSPWQIWLLFALYGLYLGLSQGILLALVADQIPATLRGTAFGLINLVTGAALLPASLLAGWLWQQFTPQAPFLLGSSCALLATLLLALSPRRP
ncbi:MFS transporter [Leptolyngbya sp. NK1-12]|uniref:MFS transporter n=1 Tax=Leptolyngbya sp. NK1-12 TaxID=2547451 RepID=A0AA97AKM5_9CYAN|nr:MFS transporter [Leptolyngbya sp. NK1-12]WNZ26341.1 MFS transporter [Leptolyngbya sp. NK1-12]